MEINELLNRLDHVKEQGGYWTAHCPAHDDRHSSLSISQGKGGKILLKCHAGCETSDIVGALRLQMSDLFTYERQPKKISYAPKEYIPRGEAIASYEYRDDAGNLLAVKDRFPDKVMMWRHLSPDGKWLYGTGGKEIPLYMHDKISNPVYLVEGEKDVDTLRSGGLSAVTSPNGAGSWKDSYTRQLRGYDVIIIPDNDEPGKKHAKAESDALLGEAASVKLLDLLQLWKDIPEKGDVTDYVEHCRSDGMQDKDIFDSIERAGTELPDNHAKAMQIYRPLSEFDEMEANWLIQGWLPEGQITLLAADGGVGKTTLACNIMAAISSGNACIIDSVVIGNREPKKVLLLTTEDSISKKLKKKLRLAGANLNNIIAPDPALDTENEMQQIKFGSSVLERLIKQYKPALCVFDPIQGYVPPDVNMGARNAMRDCLAPLVKLGEETGCTFLIICHSNKRRGASGRDRVSDSSDIWDIARSVLMVGWTSDDNIRYLSNEKNNYAQLQKTVLFSINKDGQIEHRGFSDKRDKDFVSESMMVRLKEAEPVNEKLIEALKEAANPFEAVKYSYQMFEEEHGASIWGGKQPKRALDAVKVPLEEEGYSLVTKQVKIDGKSVKGFILQISDVQVEQTAVCV